MTDSTRSTPASPAWKPLDPAERRVLGVLIEKAKTTPAGYPMTVNALVTGCNQKNNREPVTAYDDVDVENALGGLRTHGVVTEIDWLGRAPKYKHLAYEWLGVNKVELAVLAELLLRGAQALGDLRGRAARMEPIADLAALKPIVDGLVARGLMVELTPAGRGQIVSHNLYTRAELGELRARWSGRSVPLEAAGEPADLHQATPAAAEPRHFASVQPTHTPPMVHASAFGDGPAAGEELAALRAEVARLAERVRVLEARLDETLR